jgi:hypothetical protein
MDKRSFVRAGIEFLPASEGLIPTDRFPLPQKP